MLTYYIVFFVLTIIYIVVPIVDYVRPDIGATDLTSFFRLGVGIINTLLLMSLIYSRVFLIVKSYSNHRLVYSLIEDFENRIRLISNVHTCTEYIHILNKMFLQAHFPNDLCAPSTFILLFLSSLTQIIVHALVSIRNHVWYDYIQILWPLIMHIVASRLLVLNRRRTEAIHNYYISKLIECNSQYKHKAGDEIQKAIKFAQQMLL